MTVIAYRNGVMAGDCCFSNQGLIETITNKLHRLNSGALYGGAGATDERELLKRLQNVKRPSQLPSVRWLTKCEHTGIEAILVLPRPHWSIWRIGTGEELGGIEPIDTEFTAIGSGCQIALGAMAAGADAQQAVEITCRWHVYCRPPVTTIEL